MSNIVERFYEVIDKIGKRNILLAVFVLLALVTAGLYTTFSLYTTSNGLNIVDGIRTYEFILGENKTNSVVVPAKSNKNISIKVSNNSDTTLKYGLYYSSVDSIIDTSIGYIESTKKLPQTTIAPNQDYLVDIRIFNLSSSPVTIDLGIAYGTANGGELNIPSGKNLLEKYDGPVMLNEVKPGSYVTYTGNNECPETTCTGNNAGYTDSNNMGFCFNGDFSYNQTGFRVAYVKNDTAYLTSAGALECIATDETGNIALDSTETYDKTNSITNHIDNLNKRALAYCNKDYSYLGVCDNRSTWAFDGFDFKNILGSKIDINTCLNNSNSSCGLDNDIINNGGYYWFATNDNTLKLSGYFWDPATNSINHSYSNTSLGLRPVLRLRDDVYVDSGDGTSLNPYTIKVLDPDKKSSSEDRTLATKYIKNLYKDGTLVSTNVSSNKELPIISLNQGKGLMLDNEENYRYYGTNPNNYIKFNNELWRIISLSNVKTTETSSKEPKIKIIREESIGDYSYASTKANISLENVELIKELNDLYYNQKSGTCYVGSTQKKCDFSKVGLDTNARKLVSDVTYYYSNDITTKEVYPNTFLEQEKKGKLYQTKVGLIYASDYFYASDPTQCKTTIDKYKDDANCYNNWLYSNTKGQFTLLGINNLYEITKDGELEKLNNIDDEKQVYPVVYLKDSVVITKGSGTKTDPYIVE